MINKRCEIYEDERTYSLKELVSISKMSKWTIYEKVGKKLIPFHKTARRNGKLFFLGRELNEWDRQNIYSPQLPNQLNRINSCSLIKAKKSTKEDFEKFLKMKIS